MSRFVDPVHRGVAGCPLAEGPFAKEDWTACAGCGFNLAYPGRPSVGCAVRTPPAVLDAALEGLGGRDAALAETLRELRRHDRRVEPDSAAARRWLTLAERWCASLPEAEDAPEELEVAQTIARFAQAALSRGEPVEILA